MQYNTDYFTNDIFSTDYTFIANVIFEKYKPRTVIEFGCGPGHLTKALSKLGIKVDAIDGFSTPDFDGFSNILFTTIDLNNEDQLSDFLDNKQYDIAICTEVAEHLNPTISQTLIKYLTKCSPVVVFSAAVPFQGGHGHINCRSRGFWHNIFIKHNFQLLDSLRNKLRENDNLAIWYKLNMLDYVSKDKHAIDLDNSIKNIIESESYASSLFYKTDTLNSRNEAYLKYPIIKQYLHFRKLAKKVLKRS